MLNSEFKIGAWKELTDLIKSMTPNEKGYFKKQRIGFDLHAERNYLNLFNMLEKDWPLTDKEIREKLGIKNINIHSMRNFLYKQLLKSLRAFHNEKNIQYTLREMLDHAEILADKGLYDQSVQIINKGISLSDPVTLPAYQILFQTQQIQMLRFYSEEEKMRKTEEIVYSITETAESIIHSYNTRKGLTKALYFVNTYFPLRNENIKKEVLELLDELLKIPDTEKQNYRGRNTRNSAISLLYRLLNDWDNALVFQEKTMYIMEKLDTQLLNRNIPVISAHYNYGSLFLNKGDYIGYSAVLDKMRTLPVTSKAEERYLHALLLQLQLDKIIFSKNFENNTIISEAELFLKEPHPIKGIYHDTRIRLVAYYIHTGNFNAALDKINQLLNEEISHTLKTFPLHLRLLNILIHYELNNTMLLPPLIRSAYRFMLKQELKFEIENIILNFFRRILKHIQPKQLQKEFDKLKLQLQSASKDMYEQQALQSFFDYRFWLENKRSI